MGIHKFEMQFFSQVLLKYEYFEKLLLLSLQFQFHEKAANNHHDHIQYNQEIYQISCHKLTIFSWTTSSRLR